jgi:hypothetical protein
MRILPVAMFTFSLWMMPVFIKAQTTFQIQLEAVSIAGLEGMQSFAYGQSNGKWLIIGGRTDGLHRRQPFASFDAAESNKRITVVDPVSLLTWSVDLSALDTDLQEQLSATNMQFRQEGNYLYIIGGYGYSNIQGSHTTYGKLCVVDISNTILAIMNSTPITPYFRQYANENFAVSGGHLKKINSTWYLIGGHRFMGSYNPHGPDHGPGFVQEYTNQIRKFNLADDGTNVIISDYTTITDTLAFHRRDYNVVPQIFTNGNEGLTVFSGVFQIEADLPYLNAVDIESSSYSINNQFAQYYNHYHCAVLPMYSDIDKEMNSVFFGGIAQYYDSVGLLVQDNNVPFVRTIANVKRDIAGNLAEFKLPVEMPALLGAGAEFIENPDIPYYPNGILKFDSLSGDTTLAGYIYGGIASTKPNIFWINTGIESHASNLIYKVKIIKNSTSGVGQLNVQSINGLQLQVYPNPNDGNFFIKFYLREKTVVNVQITDMDGKTIFSEMMNELTSGENIIRPAVSNLQAGQTFLVTITAGTIQSTQRIIISG